MVSSYNLELNVNEYVCLIPFPDNVKETLHEWQDALNNSNNNFKADLPRGLVLFRGRALAKCERQWVRCLEQQIKKWHLNSLTIGNTDGYPMHSIYAQIAEKEILKEYLKDIKLIQSKFLQMCFAKDMVVPLFANLQPKLYMQLFKQIHLISQRQIQFNPQEIWLLRSESEQWIGCKKWCVEDAAA